MRRVIWALGLYIKFGRWDFKSTPDGIYVRVGRYLCEFKPRKR